MKCGRSAAFTLIEIMLAVSLAGIIAATALAPLVFTVSSLGDAQKEWNKKNKERAAADRIFRDVRNLVENPSFSSLKIIHKEGLAVQNDDRLLVWTGASAKEGFPVSLVVYKVVVGTALNGEKTGLYRWIIKSMPSKAQDDVKSGDKAPVRETPMDLDTETLKAKDGRLILDGADGLSFSVWNGSEWVREHDGALPQAMRTEIGEKGKNFSHEEWFPAIQ